MHIDVRHVNQLHKNLRCCRIVRKKLYVIEI